SLSVLLSSFTSSSCMLLIFSFSLIRPPPTPTLFPYTTLFRSPLACAISRDSSSNTRLPIGGDSGARVSSVGRDRCGVFDADAGGSGRDGGSKHSATSVGEVSLSKSHRTADVVVYRLPGRGNHSVVSIDCPGCA